MARWRSQSRTHVDERETGSIGWYASTSEDVLARLSSDRQGLSADEAARRLAEHGPNRLTRQQGPSAWAVLARQFTSPLIYALLIAAVVAFALGDLPDGAVVLGVVVLNALIGFVQEYRAGRAIQALAQLVSEPATVLRDERWTQVDAADLVPGDVVSIEAGARVVADLRVLQAHGLRVDESTLTGESVPVDKSAAPVGPAAELAERRSMLHGGSLVTTGSAVAAVVETGDRTELGRISGLLGGIEKTQTPLTLGIARLGSTITKIIGVVAVVLLGVALLRGFPVADAALAAITLAVAAIPEGLPAIVTIALAVGVQRMARRRAVVRELPAVETLGSTSVVCTDKTGTLTRNEMMLRRAWTPQGDEAEFEGVGYEAAGRVVLRGRGGRGSRSPVRCGSCSSALPWPTRRSWTVPAIGGPCWATRPTVHCSSPPNEAAWHSPNCSGDHPRRAVLPFDSERKYMASAPEPSTDGACRVTYFKGAPEVLLAHVDPAEADAARTVLDAVRRRRDAGTRGLPAV